MTMVPLNTIKCHSKYKCPNNLVHYIEELGSRLQRNLKSMHIWTGFCKKPLNMALQHGFQKNLEKNVIFYSVLEFNT